MLNKFFCFWNHVFQKFLFLFLFLCFISISFKITSWFETNFFRTKTCVVLVFFKRLWFINIFVWFLIFFSENNLSQMRMWIIFSIKRPRWINRLLIFHMRHRTNIFLIINRIWQWLFLSPNFFCLSFKFFLYLAILAFFFFLSFYWQNDLVDHLF